MNSIMLILAFTMIMLYFNIRKYNYIGLTIVWLFCGAYK